MKTNSEAKKKNKFRKSKAPMVLILEVLKIKRKFFQIS
jgi:hypothetical protein